MTDLEQRVQALEAEVLALRKQVKSNRRRFKADEKRLRYSLYLVLALLAVLAVAVRYESGQFSFVGISDSTLTTLVGATGGTSVLAVLAKTYMDAQKDKDDDDDEPRREG